MLSLNIFMQPLELSPSVFDENDSIRISVTTLPGEQKQAFTFEAKKMKTIRPFISVKISEKTRKLLIVIRKKNFAQKDPIIASAVIKRDNLPTNFNDSFNTEMKTIELLEPIHQDGRKNCLELNRKPVGKINLQFSLTQEFSCSKNALKAQMNKKRNGQGYSKVDSLLDDENEIDNFLFNDTITN